MGEKHYNIESSYMSGATMRTIIAVFAILMLSAAPVPAAETVLADPKPGWDNPRKILLQVSQNDVQHINNVFHNAVNLQKFYGQDNVKVAIVAYSGGLRPFLAQDSALAERVASLAAYDIEFLACGNTLDSMGKTKADLLPGLEVVTAGIAEIVERQLRGWHYIAP